MSESVEKTVLLAPGRPSRHMCAHAAAASDDAATGARSNEVEVVVPDGVFAGEEIVVAIGDDELIVTVPAGLKEGDHMVVEVPVKEDELLAVKVPDGVSGGQEMLIETPDGRQLVVDVPMGLSSGDIMDVSVPRASTQPLSASSPSPPPKQPPMKPPPRLPPLKSLDSMGDAPASAINSSMPLHPQAPLQQTLPPSTSALAAPAAAERTAERLQAPELSDDSDDEEDAGAKFGVGAPVEVLRSDGRWTLAKVTDYDEYGCTYTIQVSDGRLKYFVEEGELRIPRFLLLSTGYI